MAKRGKSNGSDRGEEIRLASETMSTPDYDEGADSEDLELMTPMVVGIAVAALAPRLLPGMAIGVASTLLPRMLPALGSTVRPLLRSAMKAGYAAVERARELTAEAGEQWEDIMAEARAEEVNRTASRPATQTRRRTRARAA